VVRGTYLIRISNVLGIGNYGTRRVAHKLLTPAQKSTCHMMNMEN